MHNITMKFMLISHSAVIAAVFLSLTLFSGKAHAEPAGHCWIEGGAFSLKGWVNSTYSKPVKYAGAINSTSYSQSGGLTMSRADCQAMCIKTAEFYAKYALGPAPKSCYFVASGTAKP